jgi:hypothetical protein
MVLRILLLFIGMVPYAVICTRYLWDSSVRRAHPSPELLSQIWAQGGLLGENGISGGQM